jgi:transposase
MTTIDLVPDQLWNAIQPLLPPEPPKPKGGRPRIPDRAVAGAIIFMLRAGLPWRPLPARELGAGSPVTCWRRLRERGERSPASCQRRRDSRPPNSVSGHYRTDCERASPASAVGSVSSGQRGR